jgi:DNA modification methylase
MNKKNKIICGDASEVLSDYINAADLIITSPPYDNLRSYKGYSFNFKEVAQAMFASLKEGGVIVWVVADATINRSETGSSFEQALYFKSLGLNLHDTMIFQKTNAIPQIYRKRYTNQFEYMFVFSKGEVKTHNALRIPCLHAGLELASTTYKNYSKGEQVRKKLANPVKKDKIKGNIWSYVVGKKKEDAMAKPHPAPFPFQLAVDHILSWTNEGDTVLDPMCGSGTSCAAAISVRRNYIGIDISEDYCQIARDRLKEIDFK